MGRCRSHSRKVNIGALSGLQPLREAWELARDVAIDPWQFAVEIQTLWSAGISNNALRWLISRGLIEHGSETTRSTAPRRRFRRIASLTLSDHDCFVLTAAGYQAASRPANSGDKIAVSDYSKLSPVGMKPAESGAVSSLRQGTEKPIWDARLRELWMGQRVVKRFKHPAKAQEAILEAFQEEGWPTAIDDPLPGQSGANPKRRLHYTVQNLNRAQKPQSIHFFINGNGELVRWELLKQRRATSARATRLQR